VGIADALLARELPDGTLMLIDGHLRADTDPATVWPVLVLDVSESEADKLLATVDPLAAMAESDTEKLDALLREVNTSSEAVAKMLEDLGKEAGCDWAKTGEVVEDEVPEPPADTITKPGDLWLLGDHRLLCGDSTDAATVDRLFAGARASLLFTSPPYGQQRDYGKAKELVQDWQGLMQGVFGHASRVMEPDGQVLVNLGLIHRDGEWMPYWDGWIAWMREQGWRRFGWYVWDQGFGLPGDWNGRLAPSHEFVFHFNRQPVRPIKCADKKPENIKARHKGGSTMRGADGVCKDFTNPGASAQPTKILDSVIRIKRMHGGHKINHPAIFPVGFAASMLQSWPGLAFEPFSGSGTTLIAAEQLGRRCYGLELEPKYCDVIVQRWENLTGKKAEVQHA
jgi:DNA modification methylase